MLRHDALLPGLVAWLLPCSLLNALLRSLTRLQLREHLLLAFLLLQL
jgi:hypothetical protein